MPQREPVTKLQKTLPFAFCAKPKRIAVSVPAVAELAVTSVERLIQSVSVTCFLSTDVGINKQPLGRYERLMNLLP